MRRAGAVPEAVRGVLEQVVLLLVQEQAGQHQRRGQPVGRHLLGAAPRLARGIALRRYAGSHAGRARLQQRAHRAPWLQERSLSRGVLALLDQREALRRGYRAVGGEQVAKGEAAQSSRTHAARHPLRPRGAFKLSGSGYKGDGAAEQKVHAVQQGALLGCQRCAVHRTLNTTSSKASQARGVVQRLLRDADGRVFKKIKK